MFDGQVHDQNWLPNRNATGTISTNTFQHLFTFRCFSFCSSVRGNWAKQIKQPVEIGKYELCHLWRDSWPKLIPRLLCLRHLPITAVPARNRRLCSSTKRRTASRSWLPNGHFRNNQVYLFSIWVYIWCLYYLPCDFSIHELELTHSVTRTTHILHNNI